MDSLVLHPTSTAQWHSLVNEAIHTSGIVLEEDLESYLVFLLMRYIEKPQLIASILALDYLEAQNSGTTQRFETMRDLGDKCLLFSGLFPGCAEKRKVKISYFVKLGRCAYASLSDMKQKQLAYLYSNICEKFVQMMDVLQCARDMTDKQGLGLLQSFELWNETQSKYAFNKVASLSCGLPVNQDKETPLN